MPLQIDLLRNESHNAELRYEYYEHENDGDIRNYLIIQMGGGGGGGRFNLWYTHTHIDIIYSTPREKNATFIAKL